MTTTKTSCYDFADRLLSGTDVGTLTYDSHGNTTRLGNTVMDYDGADRHVGSKVGLSEVDYTRDGTDRIVERRETQLSPIVTTDVNSLSSAATSVSSLSVALPAVLSLPGDVMVATVSVGAAATITTPSGWTLRNTAVNTTKIRECNVADNFGHGT